MIPSILQKCCSVCKELKPISEFRPRLTNRDGYSAKCSVCLNVYTAEWCRTHKDSVRKTRLKYREKSKEKIKRTRRKQGLRLNYSLTLEEYNQLFTSQLGCCKLCGKHQSKEKNALSVDHCHRTGIVRGLLCNTCNRALGLLQDSSEICRLAADYLESTTCLKDLTFAHRCEIIV
jgi:hypothetical protein